MGEFIAVVGPTFRSGVVGSIAFASPKSSTFTVPSSRTLMFAGLRSRWMMPALVRRFERVRDLSRDRQRFVDRNRAPRDALREILAFDQLHHQRRAAGCSKTAKICAMFG